MSSVVIKVENLSKQYRLGAVGTGSFAQDLNRSWHRITGREDPYLKIGDTNDRTIKGDSQYIWALRDISFNVNDGEVLGIIGRNGAGKSTLLKILSRTTAPTTGSIKIKGKIASLLEVGTGFHPELSGRENIFLNGAILGMTRNEIKRKFDEIIDFAGVERYVDTPVKRYSSGMYVRLAFAVAAHLEPEILVIDEVLAVGDSEFQKKAIGKMKEVSGKDGRTVIFVSHQMDAIARLCQRTLVVEQGSISFNGFSNDAISYYLKERRVVVASKVWPDLSNKQPGNEMVRLLAVSVSNNAGEIKELFKISEDIHIVMRYEILNENFVYTHGINLFDVNGLHIFTSHDSELGKKKIKHDKGFYQAEVIIPGNYLAEGLHFVSVAIMSYEPYIVHFHELEAVSFNVMDSMNIDAARGIYGGKMPGIVRPILKWTSNKINT